MVKELENDVVRDEMAKSNREHTREKWLLLGRDNGGVGFVGEGGERFDTAIGFPDTARR